METLKLYVYNKTEKLVRLAEDYNNRLGALHFSICQIRRHAEIAEDARGQLSRIEYELKDVEDNLKLLDEMNALTMANYSTAKFNYENADLSLKSVIDKDRYEELLAFRIDELKDNLLTLSQFRRKKRVLELERTSYQLLSTKSIDKINELTDDAKTRLSELQKSAVILERVLGYSIGSHMLDWCLDTRGNVIREPQLPPVEIVEYEESTALVPIEQ